MKGNCFNKSNSRKAFTLIELLVVIAVVILLAGLITPALTKARDHDFRAVCINNQRQMGLAMRMYAADNRDLMAYPNWGNTYPGWLYTPVSGNPPDLWSPTYTNNPVLAYKGGLWFQYLPNLKAYLCPADANSKYYPQRANKLSTYLQNGAVCGFGERFTNVSCHTADVWSPSCYVQWEGNELQLSPGTGTPIGAFAYNDGSTYPTTAEGMGQLHVKGGPVVSIDGRVNFISFAQFLFSQTNAPGPGPGGKGLLWWSPFSSNGR
jgi:prepilin-type N-terminal cleavage/methylation domain-containing protein